MPTLWVEFWKIVAAAGLGAQGLRRDHIEDSVEEFQKKSLLDVD